MMKQDNVLQRQRLFAALLPLVWLAACSGSTGPARLDISGYWAGRGPTYAIRAKFVERDGSVSGEVSTFPGGMYGASYTASGQVVGDSLIVPLTSVQNGVQFVWLYHGMLVSPDSIVGALMPPPAAGDISYSVDLARVNPQNCVWCSAVDFVSRREHEWDDGGRGNGDPIRSLLTLGHEQAPGARRPQGLSRPLRPGGRQALAGSSAGMG